MESRKRIACAPGSVLVRLLLLLARFLAADDLLVALRQGVEGLELGALGEPGLLAFHGLRARLLDHLALGSDGVVELVDEGAVVAPGVGAEAVARGLHEALVVLLAIVLEHLQLLFHVALGGDELAELARSLVGAGAGEVEQGLEVEAGGHRVRISRFGELPPEF